MKLIYVYTGDYRSYGTNKELWGGETIPVLVSDDFSGGNVTYDPDKEIWIEDPPYIPTEEDLKRDFESIKIFLLDEAVRITSDLRVELLLDMISDEDKERLTIWVAYSKAVKATVYGEEWPVKSEA
ncbi:virus tail fiber assembly protein lambda gpK [Enterobacter sp. BIGb0383]|uniref:tail fiber assembly protein n=1 Tax=unclassified Enterobacter TaxID=2608935 RepID=UPI000F46A52B|nr:MULTISPECIES: tail fiber assembly protein [unclassified Enterobacter]ROP61606.1 virus tail fiber assembly protein lambda gpK [Enterobacter sp. BIGb0383]ROS11767.1 virus tail fiber assembly protein lambda gpK [Enterobacter sp. BIGb0359]